MVGFCECSSHRCAMMVWPLQMLPFSECQNEVINRKFVSQILRILGCAGSPGLQSYSQPFFLIN